MISLAATLASEQEKLLACVHCGLCLEACPTYVLTGNENDSPRGRIYLMRAVEEGRLASNSPAFKLHIDRCLGCRACEPVCPAGVDYGHLLEASRAELFTSEIKRGVTYKLLRLALRHVWLHPTRLRFAFAVARFLRQSGIARGLLKSRIARLISRRFEFAMALLASSSPGESSSSTSLNVSDSPRAEGSALVSLFLGCVGEGLFSRVNRATARVLQTNGFQVKIPPAQVCCGALHAHAGDLDGARTLARRNIEAFSEWPEAPIATNAGGCGAMLAGYEHLLAADEPFRERARNFSGRIRDVSQLLQDVEIKQGAELDQIPTTYDASCHLINGQHAGNAPLTLLQAVPNLKYVPLQGAERCCGAAGVYNLLEPSMSRDILDEKVSHIRDSGAAVLATGNAGCQMQIGAGAKLKGLNLRVCHPIELLDESYARAGFYNSGDNL
jgi:glycolate dehydrogenase iron-sulfur subunit